ncbi:2-(3-amino-3-carboxypropyl)histidine synthase subunit 2 [Diorhabda carinulata]|uniref:2-(3-amino-3-carboxypropyl)histidine synthase subunit 2 n=1 Tax=Diorhabda carinulata TaxID=1163345 RepID=UPI0025A2D412|nr:2-(3-amino-3-carboxypropyl)histidine synthase subunit 2 [Diorhabda carinulata]
MTKLAFSSNETTSIEKPIELTRSPVNTNPDDLDDVYELNRCAQWIQLNKFKKVCLQFPDYLLPDSSNVILKLQSILKTTLYLLGDTAYESCCVDYIAAAHINADAIIHFGPVCFSKSSAAIPFINIYEKLPLNIDQLKDNFKETFKDENQQVVVIIDVGYIHLFDKIKSILESYPNIMLQRIDEMATCSSGQTVFFIGSNEMKLLNVALSLKPLNLYYYEGSIKLFEATNKIIRRRNYVVEKIKDSETIGIIIGTLGVKNYLKVIERMKALISQSGKKYYLISVGKPTVSKLANFPELDVYVAITCSMSEIYCNRDFYKPIAVPFDVEVALNADPERHQDFTFNFNDFIDKCGIKTSSESRGDVSLLTNKLRLPNTKESTNNDEDNQSLALKSSGTLALQSSGAGYLAQRSWQGLEQKLGQTEVRLAKEGRSGIASQYENEQF